MSVYFEPNKVTSPSGENIRAEITVVATASDSLGSPGGPLASKTFIFVTLHMKSKMHRVESIIYLLGYPKKEI